LDGLALGFGWPVLAWLAAGALVLAGAVAVDARERGQPAALWFALALLFPVFGTLAYLVLRPAPAESPAARPAAEPAAAAPAGSPAPAPSAAVEWQRGVGVLASPSTGQNWGVSTVEPRRARRPGRLVFWLAGGALVVALIVVAGRLVASRSVPAAEPPAVPAAAVQATPTPMLETPAADLSVAEPPAEAMHEPVYYTVEPGDTLESIARQFDTTVAELLEANQLENPDLLLVGQRLVVRQ
jgi:LysM repeat protein